MLKKLLFALVPVAVTVLLTSGTMSDNGKAGKCGSPGENTCRECHSSFTLNAGGGSITIQNPGMTNNEYTPGQTYTLTVTVSRTGTSVFGIGLEALTSTNQNGGTLISTTSSTTIKSATVSLVSRRNIVHTFNGGASANSKVFTFDWTAPAAGTGPVTFYYCGVATNGTANGSESNDYVYQGTSLTVTEACAAPAQPAAINGNSAVCAGSSVTYSVAAVSGATSYTWSLPSGWSGTSTSTSINATAGTSGGTVSVVANSACGSSTAQTLNATISTVSASCTAVDVTCNGGTNGSVTCTPAGSTPPFTCLWSPGGSTATTVNGLAAGSYSVVVTDGAGCTTSSMAMVAEPAAPATPVITEANGVLTSTPSTTYEWYYNGNFTGETGQSITTIGNGDYTVVTYDANGCSAVSSIFTYLSTGLSSVSAEKGFSFYPNPAGSVLHLQVNESLRGSDIYLMDALGNTVRTIKAGALTMDLDIATLPQGVYAVQAGNGSGRISYRLIVAR